MRTENYTAVVYSSSVFTVGPLRFGRIEMVDSVASF